MKEQMFFNKQMERDAVPDAEERIFNPTDWIEELLGEDANPDDDLETIARKSQHAVQELNKKFEVEKDKLENKMRVCLCFVLFLSLCFLLF